MSNDHQLPSCLTGPGGNPYARIDLDVEERREAAYKSSSSARQAPLTEQLALAPPPSPIVATIDQPTLRFRAPEGSGNPYASLARENDARPDGMGISMADFDAHCRAVFRQYVPTWRRAGALPPHYRDFIVRNRTQSARYRKRLVKALERYSLADLPNLNAQFNREQDGLTAAKLVEIERIANSAKD